MSGRRLSRCDRALETHLINTISVGDALRSLAITACLKWRIMYQQTCREIYQLVKTFITKSFIKRIIESSFDDVAGTQTGAMDITSSCRDNTMMEKFPKRS